MSWEDIDAPLSPSGKVLADVFVSASAGGGHRHPSFALSVRVARLDGLAWFEPGARVKVRIGAGEHAGMLRIEPNGAFRLSRTGVTPKAGQTDRAVTLSSTALPVMLKLLPGLHKATPVEFDYGDGWLEVTLPAWARQREAAIPPGVPVPFTPSLPQVLRSDSGKAPFKGALAGGVGGTGKPQAAIPLSGERRT